MRSEPASRFLGDLHAKLTQEESSSGRIRLGPDEHQNQLAFGVANSLAAVGLLRAVDRSDAVLDFSLNAQRTQAGARLRAFVAGQWLEIGVEQVLRSVLGEDTEVARNLKESTRPTGGWSSTSWRSSTACRDLRMQVRPPGGRGPAAFRRLARIVGVEGDRAVVVAPQLDPDEAVIAEAFFSIRIIGPGEVEAHAAELGAITVPGRNLRLVDTAAAPTPGSRSTEAEGTGPESTGGKQKVTLDDAGRAELEAIVHEARRLPLHAHGWPACCGPPRQSPLRPLQGPPRRHRPAS